MAIQFSNVLREWFFLLHLPHTHSNSHNINIIKIWDLDDEIGPIENFVKITWFLVKYQIEPETYRIVVITITYLQIVETSTHPSCTISALPVFFQARRLQFQHAFVQLLPLAERWRHQRLHTADSCTSSIGTSSGIHLMSSCRSIEIVKCIKKGRARLEMDN